MVDNQSGADLSLTGVRQTQLGKTAKKRREAVRSNPERDAAKRRRFGAGRRLPFEQRELGAALIAGDHQRPSAGGPRLELWNDLQPQHLLVPARCRISVGHEQLYVIDLKNTEHV